MSKIIPQAPSIPAAASPPAANLVGSPIEAAAAKTATATAEAAAAHSTMANPAGMSGGGVEVHVPGPKMPSGGDGPSFASNYATSVGLLDKLQNQAAGDSLTNAPAQSVSGGVRVTQDPEFSELNVPGGAITRAKHAMRTALKHLENLGRKTRRAKKSRKRTEKKRGRK